MKEMHTPSDPGGFSTFLTGLKWFASLFAALWISVDTDLRVLAVLSLADVVSTFFNAKRSLSAVIKRLAMMFLLVGVVHYVFAIAKLNTGMNIGFDVGAVVAFYYILAEIIIIVRNCAAAGLAIPPKLLDILAKAEGLTGAERGEIVGIQLKQDENSVNLKLKLKPPHEGQQ